MLEACQSRFLSLRARARARAEGAAGLVRRHGRPHKLSERQKVRARTWAGKGVSQTEIAARLGVARSVLSELLARHGVIAPQEELETAAPGPADADNDADLVREKSVPAGKPVAGQELGGAPDTVADEAQDVAAA